MISLQLLRSVEGALTSGYVSLYVRTYAVKVFVYGFVGIAKYQYSQTVQVFIANLIGLNTLLRSVLGAVQFNDQCG